jgi:anaerobic ribonucleoside-triphosphate reductase activating protein
VAAGGAVRGLRRTIRVGRLLLGSRANGPGRRAVLWVQGCSIRCPGCFNPETHDPAGGEEVDVEALLRRLRDAAPDLEGLTVSGGEPLEQAPALASLLGPLRRETRLSAILFTGLRWDRVLALPEAPSILASVDVVLPGPYDRSSPPAGDLRGTAAKSARFLTGRYGPGDLRSPPAEVFVTAEGNLELSGAEPPRWGASAFEGLR